MVLAATEHQWLVAQAVVRLVAPTYDRVTLAWYGSDALDAHGALDVELPANVRRLDWHGRRRLKPWRADGARRLAESRRAVAEDVVAPADVFLGNDNELFARVVMDVCGADWEHVVLFEEGIGTYAGAGRVPEKMAVNALLALRRSPHRLALRDFATNPRIRRVACNHPRLLPRSRLAVLDTSTAYRLILQELAERRGAADEEIAALYVSGNYSEVGHLTRAAELRLLERVRSHAAARFGGPPHVKFHPLDDAAKREAVLRLGFRELAAEGPFELAFLTRRIADVLTFRSSVLLNLALLEPSRSRVWILRDRTGDARRLERRRHRRVFDRLVEERPDFARLDVPRGG